MQNLKLGAIWIPKAEDGTPKKDKNGNSFLTGELTIGDQRIKVVIFKNGFKEKPMHPDYVIMRSNPPSPVESELTIDLTDIPEFADVSDKPKSKLDWNGGTPQITQNKPLIVDDIPF